MKTTKIEITKAIYDTYRAGKGTLGKGCVGGCIALMRMGVSQQDAADVSWRIETGKEMPTFHDSTGAPTKAMLDYVRQCDREHDED